MTDWPDGITLRPISTWPGETTQARRASAFSAAWSSTLALLDREIHHLLRSAADRPLVVLEVAIPPDQWRLDGRPRANARQTHPGVVLSLGATRHGPLRYPCDTYWRWQDNVRGVALSLEALRMVDRHGVTRRGEQYAGWAQIEAPATLSPVEARDELRSILATYGVLEGDETHLELVRRARRETHPDKPAGSREAWDRVQLLARAIGVAP